MGKVLVKATIENLSERFLAEKGVIPREDVHRLEEPDALVDTGSTFLSMPKSKLKQLAFTKPFTRRKMRTAKGPALTRIYGPARLEVGDRYCTVDIAEIAEGNPVLIGQVPLELMDYVVDPRKRRFVGNPEHGGKWMIDMY